MNYYQKIYDLLTEGSIGFKRFSRQMKARDKADKKGDYTKGNKINHQMGKLNRTRPERLLAKAAKKPDFSGLDHTGKVDGE